MRLSKVNKIFERYPACILCGNRSYEKLFNMGSTNIISCRKCGLTKTENFSAPDYEKYHRDDDYKKDEWLYCNFFQKRVSNIQKYHPKRGRVLEIGCSTGTLLQLLKEKGWETWGVEPSKSGEVARKRGIKLVKQYFETARLPQNYFDAVVLNHTLEHLENPVVILQKARRLLKSDGIIIVDVPNFGSLSSKIMGKHWGYLAPDEHLWHFTPKTLKGVAKKAGLEIIRQETASGIFDCGSPAAGLFGKLIHTKKSFFTDLATAPFAYVYSKIGVGTNLTIIGKK